MSRFNRPPAKRWTPEQAAAHQRFYSREGSVAAVVDTDPATNTGHHRWKQREVELERPNRQTIVTLVLPFPPSTNIDKRPDGRGGQILTDATREFREHVAALVMQARSPWVRGDVSVAITLYPPDRRAYDIDNRIKPTLDALQAAGVIANDRSVKRLVIAEAVVKAPGEAAVTIMEAA